MTQEQINIIISNFHCWYVDDSKKCSLNSMVPRCAEAGWTMHPNLLIQSVYNFVVSQTINPNATFYRTWHDIESKDRLELLIDQLMHYASTYGTNYEGEAWSPNDDPVHLIYQDYKMIELVSISDISTRIYQTLAAGIALKSEVVDAYCTFLIEKDPESLTQAKFDTIKNFESLCILANRFNILPTDGPMATRVVWYKLTFQTQIVQNYNAMMMALRLRSNLTLNLTEEQMVVLSRSFYRYKDMWMAIRQMGFKKTVNRIRQLARSNHQPLNIGFWEKFSSLTGLTEEQIKVQVDKLDNPFRIIRLLEMCMLRVRQNRSRTPRIFTIRNGKVWVDYNKFADVPTQFPIATKLLLEKLVYGLAAARTNDNPSGLTEVTLPKNIELAVPSTTKSFYGNYPFGSYRSLHKKTFVGVYWRNEWGTHDFDISFLDMNGDKIGWNASYDNGGATYSGDMTDASDGASEIIRFANNAHDGMVFLNRYNGALNSKYITFAGAGDYTSRSESQSAVGVGRYYMVKPDDIKLQAEGISTKKQQIIGVISEQKLYMMSFDWNENLVSRKANELLKSMVDKTKSHLMLRDVLEAAGYLITGSAEYKEKKGYVTKTIDLTDVTADSILDLLKF